MELREKELLKKQLASAVAALESALTALEAVFVWLEPEPKNKPEDQAKEPCSHPKERRVDMSTMGIKRWQCLDCDHIEEVKLNG